MGPNASNSFAASRDSIGRDSDMLVLVCQAANFRGLPALHQGTVRQGACPEALSPNHRPQLGSFETYVLLL